MSQDPRELRVTVRNILRVLVGQTQDHLQTAVIRCDGQPVRRRFYACSRSMLIHATLRHTNERHRSAHDSTVQTPGHSSQRLASDCVTEHDTETSRNTITRLRTRSFSLLVGECNDPGRYDVHRGGSRTSRQTPTHSTREALALALRKAARTRFVKEAVRATSFLPLVR